MSSISSSSSQVSHETEKQKALNFLYRYPEITDTVFSGTPKYELLAMIYILRKHKDVCGYNPFYTTPSVPIATEVTNYAVTWDCFASKGLTFPHSYFRKLAECPKRFFYSMLVIRNCPKNLVGHANMLVYDKVMGTMERFDPHGKTSDDYEGELLDKVLEDELRTKHGIEYIRQDQICPLSGPQKVQCAQCIGLASKKTTDPGGFCSAWSIFYTDTRFMNPDIPPFVLMETVINNLRENFIDITAYIRNYSMYILGVERYLETTIPLWKKKNVKAQTGYIVANFTSLVASDKINDWFRDTNELDLSMEELMANVYDLTEKETIQSFMSKESMQEQISKI